MYLPRRRSGPRLGLLVGLVICSLFGPGVDSAVAQITIDAGPENNSFTNDRTPTFEFSTQNSGAVLQCTVYVRGSTPSSYVACGPPSCSAVPCRGSYTPTIPDDGTYIFAVRDRDNPTCDEAGMPACPREERTFTVDTVAPDTVILSGPPGLTNNSAPSFAFGSNKPNATFRCRHDSTGFVPCDSPYPLPTLGNGDHSFEVYAIDSAGNSDPSPANATFTVDTVAPDTVILSGPPGLTNNSAPSFTFGSNEPNATFRCRHDNTGFVACNSPYTSPTLGNGDHSFDVFAVDVAGNSDLSPAHAAFTVDTMAPVTRITGGPAGTVDDPRPTFIFSANERTLGFECRIDDARFTGCASPFTPASALSDGDHIFEVRAIDLAGNRGPAERLSFTVARMGGGGEQGPGQGPGEQGLPPPKVGRSVNLSVVRGRVRVRMPGSGSFIVLTGDSQVPVGSQIDTRQGTVRLTSARNASGATRSAEFSLGVFKVLQSRGGQPPTDAVIQPPKCARPSAAPARNRLRMKTLGAAAAAARVLRDRPSAARRRKARWRVKGRYSIAASRATDWTTIERCARTTTVVHEGRVSVIDRVRRRTVSLGPGERYTARARR
jgi:hypothetical protein